MARSRKTVTFREKFKARGTRPEGPSLNVQLQQTDLLRARCLSIVGQVLTVWQERIQGGGAIAPP